MRDMIRRAFIVLFAVMVYGAAGAWLSSVVPADAQSEPADLQADATNAIQAFLGAIMSGEPDKLAAVLAPEFQILRADGSRYDAKSYPDSELPIIAAMPDIQNLVASRTGDILVTRYVISANQTRDGKVVETTAPRLTVFRKSGDRWLVVAHGNFAALEE